MQGKIGAGGIYTNLNNAIKHENKDPCLFFSEPQANHRLGTLGVNCSHNFKQSQWCELTMIPLEIALSLQRKASVFIFSFLKIK
jgi:hypothetical protein